MKKNIFMLLACTALVACDKSTPEPNTPTPAPPKTEVAIQHYISKIELYTEASKTKTFEISYHYDNQKRLTSFVEKYYRNGAAVEEIAGRLRYEATKVYAEYDGHKYQEDLTKPTEYLVELDAVTSRAKKLVETYYFTEPDVRTETEYTFNQAGKQTSYTSSFVIKTTNEWEGANLTKILHKRSNVLYTEKRSYTGHKNNIYPDLNLFLEGMIFTSDFKYLWSDLLGLRSESLMASYQMHTTPKDSRADSDKTFVYQLDAKGRPERIIQKASTGDDNISYHITYVEP